MTINITEMSHILNNEFQSISALESSLPKRKRKTNTTLEDFVFLVFFVHKNETSTTFYTS